MAINLTLQYQRPSWLTPETKNVSQVLPKIQPANFSGGLSIDNSSVLSPNDQAVITAEEDVSFVLTLMLPVSSIKNIAVVVKGDGIHMWRGVVSGVGSGVISEDGSLLGEGKLK